MIHDIPITESVNRVMYLVAKCKGKRVLHLGSTGPLHNILKKVVESIYGIDRVESSEVDEILDLEKGIEGIKKTDFDLVLCAEILEHLSCPGNLLASLSSFGWPLIVTVPNAFSSIGNRFILKGKENVNLEHVAYYSYFTLKELTGRYGYKLKEFFWYNGQPLIAEGLIFYMEPSDDNKKTESD